MNPYYQDLEYNTLKGQLRGRCHSEPGKALCDAMQPLSDITSIRKRLEICGEAQGALKRGIDPAFTDVEDLDDLFHDAVHNVFAWEEFQRVTRVAAVCDALANLTEATRDWPLLHKALRKVLPLPGIVKRFYQIFDPEGEVLDGASPELARIRKRGTGLRGHILKTMQAMLSDHRLEGYLQDKFVTQRDDRYVLPIREGAAANVPGIVQGHSGSRSTLFVEPQNVVPLNNELQMLKQEEKKEIYRIFAEFTADIRALQSEILHNVEQLSALDFLFACGRFGNDLDAHVPRISEEPVLELITARHPLLILRLGGISKVIPFDLQLGVEKSIMVLSGPNTGGKTVLMKSVGLLALMAMSGLPVPVSPDSVIGMFNSVFADIGDDQSIENALSTFSSHLEKIRRMLENAGDMSLVLIDEIGAATDPQQGSALAQAVLERFAELRCRCIVTTHYTALKIWAENEPGAMNAAMQFDLVGLQPTYRFSTGFPGDSFAIEVAASLGIAEDLVERAKSLSGSQNREFTELLRKMQEEKKALARESYEYRLKNRNLDARIEELESRSKVLDDELKARKQKFLKDLQAELISRQKLYARELNELKTLERTERKAVSERKLHETERELSALQQELISAAEHGRKRKFSPKPGDRVWLANFEADAVVLEVRDADVVVDMNGISFKTTADMLFESANAHQEAQTLSAAAVKGAHHTPTRAAFELKLLGLTFDEAAPLIDDFIDSAVLAGLHSLRIVHGKGTGALRSKVRDYLRRKKQVLGIDTPTPSEGGSGVTLVKL